MKLQNLNTIIAAWIALSVNIAVAQDSAIVRTPELPQQALSVLTSRCAECHRASAREGGLRLGSHADLLLLNDSGMPAVAVGESTHSELIRRITTNDDDRMPPEGSRLTDIEIQILSQWIDAGAVWPKDSPSVRHWAYEKPVRPTTPDSAGNPIDFFVQANLQKHASGLQPSPREDPARLLRRVYLDLIGLPPAPSDVDAFLTDPSAAHFAKIVDELLASPRYGEKWARQWLDLARYADSNGYQADQFRSVWAYRDWVIDAMNADMPFDQFTIEQLAGDLLPDAAFEQRIATGFHRLTTCNVEAGVDPEENRTNQVADRVHTTGTVWLGTTMECARCHNHKYDPFSQQDYYQLFAFFNNTPLEVDPPAGGGVQFEVAGPKIELPISVEQQTLRTQLREELKQLRAQKKQADEASKKRISEIQKMLTQVQPPTSVVMVEMAESRPTFIMKRGDFLSPGANVKPTTPAALHAFRSVETPTRLDLAQWIVSPENPLTARVTVNRWWSEFFGRGIVSTLEDFGTQGSPPTHPELLDWLATELIEHSWSTKYVHRQIVLSSTYQQSSRMTASQLEIDPSNSLLARGPRYRMSAETIRDNALAISGLLSSKMGGPPVYPPQPEKIWRHVGRNAPKYDTDTDEDRFRRGVYVVWRRSAPYPSFVNFDAPDRASCVVGRSRSNTPLQALTLMNDPAYVEMALALARRIQVDTSEDDLETRLKYAVRLCVARTPKSEEIDALLDLWQQEFARFSNNPELAELLIPVEQRHEASSLPAQAAWFSVANVLLNLDETITKN